MKILYSCLILALLGGCTTIHFDQNEPVAANPSREHSNWHHNMVFALIEVSKPVDLQKKCGANGWSSVKTEETFLNGLVGSIPYVAWIWSPKTATVQCKGKIVTEQ